MELSEEMKEAIRILREDGQIASFNAMSTSHKELIGRLDEVENNWSEFRASQKETPTGDPTTDSGKTSSDPVTDPSSGNGPEPPPVKETTPVTETKTRLRWYERGGYAQ